MGIDKDTLGSALEGVVGAALRGTGWRLAGAETELGQGQVRLRIASEGTDGSLHVAMVVAPRAGTVRDTAQRLQAAVRAAEGPVSRTSAVLFFPRAPRPLVRLLTEMDQATVDSAGGRICGIGFIDLYGACRIRVPGLFIERSGQDKPVVSLSREASIGLASCGRVPTAEASVFGPRAVKRQRVLRVLLSHPGRHWHQTDLANEAAVTPYTAHTTVGFLLAEQYADTTGRGPTKKVTIHRPGDLINTWAYYWRDTWRRGLRAAGRYRALATSTDAIVESLARAAEVSGVRLGLTLSAGAGRYGSFLRDDVVHAYVAGPESELVRAADLEPVLAGPNVILQSAPDEGILYLPAAAAARFCREKAVPVSPVQLFLDMSAAGGRHAEQAEELAKELLGHG